METQCGQSVELMVTVSRTDAIVKWTKDGQELDDDRIRTESAGEIRKLFIDKVRYPGDSGIYQCSVLDGKVDEKVDVELEVQKAFETILTPFPEMIESIAGKEIIVKTEVSAEDVQVTFHSFITLSVELYLTVFKISNGKLT